MTAVEFLEIIRPLAGDPSADGFEDRLEGYWARCRSTQTLLLQHRPSTCQCVLDVGCGMGGIGLLLAEQYRANGRGSYASADWQGPQVALLDGDASVREISGHRPKGYASFSKDNQPWNDATQVAARFREFDFAAIDLTPKHAEWPDCHVIVSTRSWGHHYPVTASHYLDKAVRCLQPGGIIALEIRNGTDGIERMQERFRLVDVMPAVNSTKCQMVVFKHK